MSFVACDKPASTTQPATTTQASRWSGWQAELQIPPPPSTNPALAPPSLGRMEAGPCLFDDRVIVADTHGNVGALALSDGHSLWSVALPDAIYTTPLADLSSKTVYLADILGNIYAMDSATGKIRWRCDNNAPIHAALSYTPDHLLLAANDAGTLTALDPASGKTRWSVKVSARVNAPPAWLGKKLVTGTCDSQLFMIDPAEPNHRQSQKLPGVVPGSPVLTKTTDTTRIFVGTDHGHLLCFDTQLQLIWDYTQISDQAMVLATPAGYLPSASSEIPPTVLLTSHDHRVHAVDLATGQQRWTFTTAGEIDAPPLIVGDIVFIAGKDAFLRALDISSGKQLWKYRLQKSVVAPMVYRPGTPANPPTEAYPSAIVCADEDGTVYTIVLPKTLIP